MLGGENFKAFYSNYTCIRHCSQTFEISVAEDKTVSDKQTASGNLSRTSRLQFKRCLLSHVTSKFVGKFIRFFVNDIGKELSALPSVFENYCLAVYAATRLRAPGSLRIGDHIHLNLLKFLKR